MGLVFTYLLCYGGAAISLFRPFYGLLIYICFAIIKPESLWYWSVPSGNYSRVVAFGLLAGWALHGFSSWRLGRATAIVAALLGFLGWSSLSATQATEPTGAWTLVEGLSKIVLPFVVGITTIDSARQLRQLAWVIVLSEGYVAYDLNISYLGGFNRLVELGFGGMDNNCVAIGLVATAGLGLFLGLSAGRWWLKILALGATACMLHAVLFSFSRGGMLGLITTGALSFLLIPKRWAYYIALVVVVLVGLRLAGPQVVNRFMSTFASEETRDYSAQSRVEMWKICIRVMAERPILGLGPAQFKVHAAEFGLTAGKEAHSLWAQTGAEVGVPGIVFLLTFYLLTVLRLAPMIREKYHLPDPELRDLARMVIAALGGFLVSVSFVTLPGLEIPYYVVLIGAGVLKLASLPRPVRSWEGLGVPALTGVGPLGRQPI
jgi:putative inorganic carbon (hco3(-)) transporter